MKLINSVNNIIGTYSVPAVLFLVAILLLRKDKDLFFEFLEGTKQGMQTCIDILPTLVMLLTAVGMFSASGAKDILVSIVEKPANLFGIPSEILPTVIMRPFSGSATNASAMQLFTEIGPDSFPGRCISVIMGSSDTIIYTLAMYFGAIGVKKTRYAIPVSFLTMVFCTFISVWLCVLFFGK